jgi:UDP-hydrolysing UDP-N-acetyl-D-glucosamine 2-epimerase
MMETVKRKILVVLVDRANYGRMRMVLKAIEEHLKLELMVMCAGSMVLERFGNTITEVEGDGFTIHSKIFMELEGSVPLSMAKSLGFGVIEFASEYNRLQPDIVLLIGDRYEALAAALSAAYMNVPIAHIQGGEVSGGIDESTRHAITKFAQWHFPATDRAAEYIRRMGESEECVYKVGCPVGDYILKLDDQLPDGVFYAGSGSEIDPNKGFYLVIFHPVTTQFGSEKDQVRELLAALNTLRYPTLFLWPNIDAGADYISKELRLFREHHSPEWLRFMTNLPPEDFQKVLKRCTVAIGNSSSFVRDTTFSGTPVVLVGDRQKGREMGKNVVCVDYNRSEIREAISRQMEQGRYKPDNLYGDGMASQRIADILANVKPYVQKRLDYINRKKQS